MFKVFVKIDGEWERLAWNRTKEQARSLVLALTTQHDVEAEYRPQEPCKYCGGTCPEEPDDSKHLCDGFAGDIDNLYK